MKIHKLIELWKEMSEGVGMNHDTAGQMNPEEILNVIQFLDRCVRRAGYHYTLAEPAKETGFLHLSVTKEECSSKAAEVKIWDNSEHQIKSRFSLRRAMTDEEGHLLMPLPCGEYEAVVSCGPEYTSQTVHAVIEENKTCESRAVLKRAVHMEKLGWLAGDLHHHSVYSSPAWGGTDPVIETPEEVCRSMKALGMQFGALSDHHNTLNHDVWKRQNRDFTPIVSKEISTSNGHVLSLGVDDDVIYQIPKGEERTSENLRAEFVRICEEIRQKGGLPQVNHPFDASYSTRFNSEFLDMIEIFQSMEIWNGATPFADGTINDKAFQAWLGYLEEGKYLTATAGSDTHNIYGDDYFGMAEWIDWLMETVIRHPETYPEEIRGKVDELIGLYQKVFPKLRRWVECSCSPSNIHNYVRTDGDRSQEGILKAIREGKVFISNGPLFVPSINGAGIGETAALEKGKGKLQIFLFSKEKIAHLYLYTGASMRQELTPEEKRTPEGFYDYSMTADAFEFGEITDGGKPAWAVFTAEDGPNCLAVCNPIYLREK